MTVPPSPDSLSDRASWPRTTVVHRSATFPQREFLATLRKSKYHNDPVNQQLIHHHVGFRVWYKDYTTIDWIHATIKNKLRMKDLYLVKGWKGIFLRWSDKCQSWMLIVLIGFICGGLASFIQLWTLWFNDLKLGYCSGHPLRLYRQCCPSKLDQDIQCSEWKTWSSLLQLKLEWINFGVYILFSILFAALASVWVTQGNHWLVCLDVTENESVESDTTKKIVYHAAGSGIPELKTILSGFVIRGFLGGKTLIIKSIALIFAVSSGMLIGTQGPLIHISCCVGNICSRLFPKYALNEGKKREILSAASAAGVSVAFGAPIGGVLFSLEEISYYFPSKTMLRSFVCALMAAFTVKFINPLGTGKLVSFQVSYQQDWHLFEILPFLFIAIVGGIFGGLFILGWNRWMSFKKSFIVMKWHLWLEVILIAGITAGLSYWDPNTRAPNADFVGLLFGQDSVSGDLSKIVALKLFLMLFTFGSTIPTGVFLPGMVVGAAFGRIVGQFMLELTKKYPNSAFFADCSNICLVPGVYAMIGAASVLSGITRMTLSLTVIMFELTGTLNYILPIMVVVMVSKWIAEAICADSLYNTIIHTNHHPYLDHKKEFITRVTVEDLMEDFGEWIDINLMYTISDLVEKLNKLERYGMLEDGGIPILNNGLLVGFIACTELSFCISMSREEEKDHLPCIFQSDTISSVNDFSDFVDQAPMTLSKNSPVDLVIEVFMRMGARSVLVTQEGRYVGTIFKKNLLKILSQEQYQ